jgi:hypothetical protein
VHETHKSRGECCARLQQNVQAPPVNGLVVPLIEEDLGREVPGEQMPFL